MSDFDGNWELTRYGSDTAEIAYDDTDDGPRETEIRAWLIGNEVSMIGNSLPQTGLRITIEQNRFEESVFRFDELMFDVDGVQVNDYQPMSGNLSISERVAFMAPDESDKPASLDGTGAKAVRYDDGDTKVCDTLRLSGQMLVRQTSVVTDEIYLERMLLIYRRIGDA